MIDAEPDELISMHYDTTKRRRIHGDWSSLIIKMSNGNGKCFRLRPLSLATETRDTIADLMVVELKRLATAGDTKAATL